GATFTNVNGKTSRALAFIDEQNRLRVSVGTEELYRSGSVVGGGGEKIEVIRDVERGGRSYFFQLEPTPLAIDLDGDGVEEIIVSAPGLKHVTRPSTAGSASRRAPVRE